MVAFAFGGFRCRARFGVRRWFVERHADYEVRDVATAAAFVTATVTMGIHHKVEPLGMTTTAAVPYTLPIRFGLWR